eukprot:GFUD01021818.1.p2 GENE.GFUD01021818.1~~GFUD01021818.1.p2  ORF type:complete len:211 (-),score=55.11 GFUD01021818.1:220-852(-)
MIKVKMARKNKPNFFLAIPVANSDVKENIEQLQQDYLAKDDRLKEFVVPVATAHVTLVVFHVEEQRLEESKRVVRAIYDECFVDKNFENIVFRGLGKFGSKVIYAKPVEGLAGLNVLNESFTNGLIENGFEVCGDGFNPHLTIFKGKRQRGRKEKKVKMKVMLDNFSELSDHNFGEQEVNYIQFLSMDKKKDENGYYFCEDSYKLLAKNP